MQRRFSQVDVFTTTRYRGNPVAVVLDGAGLTTAQMQQCAHWTNLSETTFVLAPEDPAADYRVRIFTPTLELPFAGHPTLGTCHAWLEAGGRPRGSDVVQECGAGLVRVRRAGSGLAFAAPPIGRYEPADEDVVQRAVEALGIPRADVVDAHWVDNGPGWLALLLPSADAVLAVEPGFVGDLDLGVVGPYPAGSPVAFEVRAFFGKDRSTVEDPVTGSLNASLGQWLLDTGRARTPYVAAQGTALGREGRVHVDRDPDGQIWVGGGTLTCVTGEIEA
jgi:PhzF family phenazine biosynthesis protein